MKRAALLAALLAAGAAAADTIPVRWVRVNEFPQSEVRDGACVIYAPDTAARSAPDRVPLEPLVRRCIERGGLQPGAGDFDVTWVRHANDVALHAAYVREKGQPALTPKSLLRPRYNGLQAAGFSRVSGRACTIWTSDAYPSLGHELKHCYEGSWHQ